MRLYVVRHANAGSRSTWRGNDRDRPLSDKGEKQALGIADKLGSRPIRRVVSGPAARCVQTVEPLAERLGITVEIDRRLDEGHDGEDALELATELRSAEAVLCSHGDVIPDLLHLLANRGTVFRDPMVWPKGSTWALRWEDGRITRARFIPSPG
jgi:8-oxo-dGTP diphosphatase